MSIDGSNRADSAHDSREPEPVDAEFEPADGAPPPPRVPRQRSRYVGYRELLVASVLSGSIGAAGGAAIAIAAAGSDSGATTGTLAQRISNLSIAQDTLTTRATQTTQNLVALRGQVAGQSETLAAQQQSDAAMRLELAALTGQVSAIAGLGDGAPIAGAMASDSPLGVLLARLNRVETTLAADAASPMTTRQLQRTSSELSERVASLAAEQTQISLALNRRQLALDTLATGLEAAQLQLAGLNARVDNVAPGRMAGGVDVAAFISPEGSRVIRALAALETAAASGQPFLSQQKTLAALLPSDPDVVALEDTARGGAASLESLRRGFSSAAQAAERIVASPRWDWLNKTLAYADEPPAQLADPDADPPPSSVAPHLIAARIALEAGDVAAALAAIDRLEGPAAAIFAPWRQSAAIRADVDHSLQALAIRLSGAIETPTEG